MSGAQGGSDDAELRSQLSRLNALLVLSMLMTETSDEQQIITLGARAAPSFADCRLVGVLLADSPARDAEWITGDGSAQPQGLAELPELGGPVDLHGAAWAWAFSLGGAIGYMIVAADRAVDDSAAFLLHVLALQVGTALRNSRQHAFERAAADEMASLNVQLADTVDELRQRIDIHDRLTQAAVSGEGLDGIARAVHEMTGRPVIIEGRYGDVRAFAGEGEMPQLEPISPEARDAYLRALLASGLPTREPGRLVQAVSPRPGSVAVISLIDPDGAAGDLDLMALEYGATVLSLELARLRSIADTEVRLRRDLLEDLLSGTNLPSALERAEAFQHDLTRPHRVIVVEAKTAGGDDEHVYTAVRRAARDVGAGPLVVARGGAVVLLTDRKLSWEHLLETILRELGPRSDARLGVSATTSGVDDFAGAYREARVALDLLRGTSSSQRIAVFDQLGVFRLLASAADPREIRRFVREWLGALLDYDAKRDADLTLTLSTYLEHGGHYDEAAAALYVHRSTLKYRLQRIREVSGHSLTDPDTVFNLHLACRAWRTLDALTGAADYADER